MAASKRFAQPAHNKDMPDQPDDERELVTLTMRGDDAAFSALYAHHAATAYGAAYRLLGSAADAEDVVQELFLALPATLGGFDPGRGPLGAWLRRVAVRLALMRLRTVRRRRETDAGAVAALLAREDAALERLSIEDALARLSEEQRTVFLLKEVEGYEHREIAALLEISVANSEVRLFRARQALRALLGGSR
jgi:RNA polymerase sigma-70 factor, ECF subfamily